MGPRINIAKAERIESMGKRRRCNWLWHPTFDLIRGRGFHLGDPVFKLQTRELMTVCEGACRWWLLSQTGS